MGMGMGMLLSVGLRLTAGLSNLPQSICSHAFSLLVGVIRCFSLLKVLVHVSYYVGLLDGLRLLLCCARSLGRDILEPVIRPWQQGR
jgi:hypothetical protein